MYNAILEIIELTDFGIALVSVRGFRIDFCLTLKPKLFDGRYVSNSVPSRRCRNESNTPRFCKCIFSQMPTCFSNADGVNVREHIAHGLRSTISLCFVSSKLSVSERAAKN